MRVKEQPTGVEMVVKAVADFNETELAVSKCRTALQLALEAHAKSKERLEALISVGKCSDETHVAPPPSQALVNAVSAVVDDPNVPKQWRVAFALLEQERLDYQRTAERIWGPATSKKEIDDAKNRISSNLQILRKLGIVETLGDKRFKVNGALLAEKSGLPVPPEEVPS